MVPAGGDAGTLALARVDDDIERGALAVDSDLAGMPPGGRRFNLSDPLNLQATIINDERPMVGLVMVMIKHSIPTPLKTGGLHRQQGIPLVADGYYHAHAPHTLVEGRGRLSGILSQEPAEL